jgi:hypothetical protein
MIHAPTSMKTTVRHLRSLSNILIASIVIAQANAQPVVAPSASASSRGGSSSVKLDRPAIAPSSSIASALSAGAPLFQRGPIAVRPHLEYRILYADGLQATPGDQRETFIQSASPGVLFELGKYGRLDYTPTLTYYSNEAFRDAVDHLADLAMRIPHRRGSIGASQNYESSHAMLVETGRQIHQENYSTMVEATYEVGLHTMLETSASRSVRRANAMTELPVWTAVDWVQWSSVNWLRYQFTRKLEAGVGATFGYADLAVGTDMTFVTPQVRVSWMPSEKITLTAQAGQEDRRFETGSRPHLRSPVYTGSAAYQILPTTRISFGASRSISASYFANEVTKSKGWNVGAQQRFLQKFYVDANLAQMSTTYIAPHITSFALRQDHNRVINVRVNGLVFHRISAALLFQTSRNSSNDVAYRFNTNQYGFELSLRW